MSKKSNTLDNSNNYQQNHFQQINPSIPPSAFYLNPIPYLVVPQFQQNTLYSSNTNPNNQLFPHNTYFNSGLNPVTNHYGIDPYRNYPYHQGNNYRISYKHSSDRSISSNTSLDPNANEFTFGVSSTFTNMNQGNNLAISEGSLSDSGFVSTSSNYEETPLSNPTNLIVSSTSLKPSINSTNTSTIPKSSFSNHSQNNRYTSQFSKKNPNSIQNTQYINHLKKRIIDDSNQVNSSSNSSYEESFPAISSASTSLSTSSDSISLSNNSVTNTTETAMSYASVSKKHAIKTNPIKPVQEKTNNTLHEDFPAISSVSTASSTSSNSISPSNNSVTNISEAAPISYASVSKKPAIKTNPIKPIQEKTNNTLHEDFPAISSVSTASSTSSDSISLSNNSVTNTTETAMSYASVSKKPPSIKLISSTNDHIVLQPESIKYAPKAPNYSVSEISRYFGMLSNASQNAIQQHREKINEELNVAKEHNISPSKATLNNQYLIPLFVQPQVDSTPEEFLNTQNKLSRAIEFVDKVVCSAALITDGYILLANNKNDVTDVQNFLNVFSNYVTSPCGATYGAIFDHGIRNCLETYQSTKNVIDINVSFKLGAHNGVNLPQFKQDTQLRDLIMWWEWFSDPIIFNKLDHNQKNCLTSIFQPLLDTLSLAQDYETGKMDHRLIEAFKNYKNNNGFNQSKYKSKGCEFKFLTGKFIDEHAEMLILAEIRKNFGNPDYDCDGQNEIFKIGVSKLSCGPCYLTLKFISGHDSRVYEKNISYRTDGTHGKFLLGYKIDPNFTFKEYYEWAKKLHDDYKKQVDEQTIPLCEEINMTSFPREHVVNHYLEHLPLTKCIRFESIEEANNILESQKEQLSQMQKQYIDTKIQKYTEALVNYEQNTRDFNKYKKILIEVDKLNLFTKNLNTFFSRAEKYDYHYTKDFVNKFNNSLGKFSDLNLEIDGVKVNASDILTAINFIIKQPALPVINYSDEDNLVILKDNINKDFKDYIELKKLIDCANNKNKIVEKFDQTKADKFWDSIESEVNDYMEHYSEQRANDIVESSVYKLVQSYNDSEITSNDIPYSNGNISVENLPDSSLNGITPVNPNDFDSL